MNMDGSNRDALLRDGVQRKRTDKLPRSRIRFGPCTRGAAVTAQFAFGGSSSKSCKRSRGKRSLFELLRNDWRIATKETPLDHRSTSPKTISSEPKIALTSASIDLRQRKSIAARCTKPGALILQRPGTRSIAWRSVYSRGALAALGCRRSGRKDDQMRRREFMAGPGAVASPAVALAQQKASGWGPA